MVEGGKTSVDKTEFSGLITLFIGVALLTFTFLNAYWFLTRNIGLVATSDLVNAFGEALAPLIATCIRVMYLGIMGWIGSMLTLRGIPLLTHKKKELTVPKEIRKQTQIPQKQVTVPVKQTVKAVPQAKEKEKVEKVEEPAKPSLPPQTTPDKQPTQEKTVEEPKPAEAPQEPNKLDEEKEKEEKEEEEKTTEEIVVYPATVTHEEPNA